MQNPKFALVVSLVAVVIAAGTLFKPVYVNVTISPDQKVGATGTRYPNGLVSGSGSLAAAGDFVADTNTLVVTASNNRVGFSTTTPGAAISYGASGTTTTIYAGPPCFWFPTDGSGTSGLFYWPSTSTANAAKSGWATSTTACYSSP